MLEVEIEKSLAKAVESINRPDLFRQPIVAFSSAQDKRYLELKHLVGNWHALPTDLLPEANSIISYFVPFTKAVVVEPKTTRDGSPLWSEAYEVINRHFDMINDSVSALLANFGHKSVKATFPYDPQDLKSIWSHRSAAAISGLGVFGANRLLITQKGSGGRFSTVITSAKLAANNKPFENKCQYIENGTCGLCFAACPVNALHHNAFDKFVCDEELLKNQKNMRTMTHLQNVDTCGKCISACPFSYIE